MRLFGIKMRRDRPTDEQYIEQLRRSLNASHWRRYGVVILSVVILLLLLQLIPSMINTLNNISPPGSPQNLFYLTFGIAVAMGLTLGLLLAGAVAHLASLLFESRKDKMLVECWDALHESLPELDENPNQNMD